MNLSEREMSFGGKQGILPAPGRDSEHAKLSKENLGKLPQAPGKHFLPFHNKFYSHMEFSSDFENSYHSCDAAEVQRWLDKWTLDRGALEKWNKIPEEDQRRIVRHGDLGGDNHSAALMARVGQVTNRRKGLGKCWGLLARKGYTGGHAVEGFEAYSRPAADIVRDDAILNAPPRMDHMGTGHLQSIWRKGEKKGGSGERWGPYSAGGKGPMKGKGSEFETAKGVDKGWGRSESGPGKTFSSRIEQMNMDTVIKLWNVPPNMYGQQNLIIDWVFEVDPFSGGKIINNVVFDPSSRSCLIEFEDVRAAQNAKTSLSNALCQGQRVLITMNSAPKSAPNSSEVWGKKPTKPKGGVDTNDVLNLLRVAADGVGPENLLRELANAGCSGGQVSILKSLLSPGVSNWNDSWTRQGGQTTSWGNGGGNSGQNLTGPMGQQPSEIDDIMRILEAPQASQQQPVSNVSSSELTQWLCGEPARSHSDPMLNGNVAGTQVTGRLGGKDASEMSPSMQLDWLLRNVLS